MFRRLLNQFNPKKGSKLVRRVNSSYDTVSTNGVDIDEITVDREVEFSAWYRDHLVFLSPYYLMFTRDFDIFVNLPAPLFLSLSIMISHP
jgi:hypothetical protein